ncbi:MAG: type VI secretion system-associated protein TagO [Reyranellaceae bacterium]
MGKLGTLVAACVGLWSAAVLARNDAGDRIEPFVMCTGCDEIVPPEIDADVDDRIRVDKALKEALDGEVLRSARVGRMVVDRGRRILSVQLFSARAVVATAERQADGTFRVLKSDDAPKDAKTDDPHWLVTTKIDKFDGAKTVIMMARAEDEDGYISVRCLANKTDVIVAWPRYLGSQNGQVIQWRLDNKPASSEYWSFARSGRALFAPQPIVLLKQMFKAGEFAIRVRPYATVQQSLLFKLGDLESDIAPLRQACSW